MQFTLISGKIIDVKDVDVNHKGVKIDTGTIDIPEIGLKDYRNILFLTIKNYYYIYETDGSISEYQPDVDTGDVQVGKNIEISRLKFVPSITSGTNTETEVSIKNMCTTYINSVNFKFSNKFTINSCSIEGKLSKPISIHKSNNLYNFSINSRIQQIPVIVKNSNVKPVENESGLFVGSIVCFPENYGTSRGRHGIYGEFLKENEDKRDKSQGNL